MTYRKTPPPIPIKRALNLGIGFFDMAPLYGAGKTELRYGADSRVGAATLTFLPAKWDMRSCPKCRGQSRKYFSLMTILPTLQPTFDFSYDGVMRSLEGSLTRLGLDRIDILHIHDPTDHFDAAMKGAYVALDKLRRERVIGAVGVGTTEVETLIRFVQAGDFDCILLAGRYTLLDHSALKDALPLCRAKGSASSLAARITAASWPRARWREPPTTMFPPVRRFWKKCGKSKTLAGNIPSLSRRRLCNFHSATRRWYRSSREQDQRPKWKRTFASWPIPFPRNSGEDLKKQNLLPQGIPVPEEVGAM